MNALALFGGEKAVTLDPGSLFTWPIVTDEDEAAVLGVLRRGAMSGTDVTQAFEQEFAAWNGTKHALGACNGTASILAALFGCKIGAGDEVICTSIVYWAAALPCLTLGAKPVFADIDPNTLCIDPEDIEHRINARTRALIVVHNYAYPAPMDQILEVARKHGLKITGLYLGGVDTPFWDNPAIELKVQRDRMLSPENAAEAILFALAQPSHLVLGDLTLQPESHQL